MNRRCQLLSFALLTAAAGAQNQYVADDGSTENALNQAGLTEIGMVQAFAVAGGGTDTIVEVQVAIGTALAPMNGLDGNAFEVAIWEDPNDDGDPDDAVLVYVSAPGVVMQSNADIKVPHAVTSPPQVTGGFFVGVVTDAIAGQFPVGLDSTSASVGTTRAYFFGDATAADLSDLNANSTAPTLQTNAVFLLSATGDGGLITTNFCGPAVPNSSGSPAAISATGTSVLASNDVQVHVVCMPQDSFGYFLNSRVPGFVAQPGGSQGNLCLMGQIGRHQSQVQNSGTAGAITIRLDLTGLPTPSGPVAVMAGESWYFQAWFRDANPSSTSNFSDGIELTFF